MAIRNDTLDSWDDPEEDEFTKALEEEGFWDEPDDEEPFYGAEGYYADDDW